jgi:GntR family transcriptional regulator
MQWSTQLAHAGLMTRPLYLQVHDALSDRIAGGEWGPGSAIPNELDLSREYGVSAGTMRKALDVMEAERLVTRQQGRGTFVIDQTSEELAVRFTNVRDANGARVAGQAEAIDVTQGAADEQECVRLQLGMNEAVYRVRCVRRHEGRPYMVEKISIPAAPFPTLLQTNGFPHDISALAQAHGMLLGKAEERISVQPAPPEVAEALLVAPASPLMVLDRVMLTLDGRRIEWRLGQCHLAANYYLAQTS